MASSKALTWKQRPWGAYLTVFTSSEHTVKLLNVLAGESLSLQYHQHREEYWTLVQSTGDITFTINGKVLTAQHDVRYHVPRRVVHRITNNSADDALILEVMSGRYDEDDIIRINDKYGRV